MNERQAHPRYSIRTNLKPQDPVKAADRLETTLSGEITEAEFSILFPHGCLQDAMCHNGTNIDGRPHVYFADDVLESELDPSPDSSMSHQSMFIKSLMALEGTPEMPTEELRSRARSMTMDKISPSALRYLFLTADSGYEPEYFICEQIARAAHDQGIRSKDFMAPREA